VALLNAGNSYSPGQGEARVPSGVLVNYAQRVDMLRHLLDGDADNELRKIKNIGPKIRDLPTGAKIAVNRITTKSRTRENDNIKLVSVSEETAIYRSKTVSTKARRVPTQADHTVAVSGGLNMHPCLCL